MERMTITDHAESCSAASIREDAMDAAQADRTLRIFKALSDETRYAIFRLIMAQDEPICACDIVDRFDVSQPTIAHHLKVLRTAGLITVSRRGVWAYYAPDVEGIGELETLTRGFAASLEALAVR
jgi:ArsR family transcriptional regulator